jgi:hypothetical protein
MLRTVDSPGRFLAAKQFGFQPAAMVDRSGRLPAQATREGLLANADAFGNRWFVWPYRQR